jgi:hypothetical protein
MTHPTSISYHVWFHEKIWLGKKMSKVRTPIQIIKSTPKMWKVGLYLSRGEEMTSSILFFASPDFLTCSPRQSTYKILVNKLFTKIEVNWLFMKLEKCHNESIDFSNKITWRPRRNTMYTELYETFWMQN